MPCTALAFVVFVKMLKLFSEIGITDNRELLFFKMVVVLFCFYSIFSVLSLFSFIFLSVCASKGYPWFVVCTLDVMSGVF